jgi:guanine deaminase
MKHCSEIDEALFVQLIMGDDRATRATYVAGKLEYDRDGQKH